MLGLSQVADEAGTHPRAMNCFMALYAAARLEGLRSKHRLKHFAAESKTLSQGDSIRL